MYGQTADVCGSFETQKKSNDINTETETTSGKKDEFQYSFKTDEKSGRGLAEGLAYLDKILNITSGPDDLGTFFELTLYFFCPKLIYFLNQFSYLCD